MGNCQNYGPFLGPYYNTGPNLGDPKRDHNFDNPPYPKLRLEQPVRVAYEATLEQNAVGGRHSFKTVYKAGLGITRV